MVGHPHARFSDCQITGFPGYKRHGSRRPRVHIAAGVAAVAVEHTSVRTVAPVAPAIHAALGYAVIPPHVVALVYVSSDVRVREKGESAQHNLGSVSDRAVSSNLIKGAASAFIFALTMLHAVILTIGSLLVIERFLRMFSSSETVIDLGVRYSRIIFLFTIAIMANLYFEKVFQAVGRMKVTMTGMMVGCIVNIILDPLIIFGIGPFPRLGIEGAALATGIGQVTPVVIYWIIYKIRPISVKIRPEYLKEGKNLVGRLYAIGVPAILNLALPSLLISALNGILAVYSQRYVVVLGIYYKLQTFIYLTANGIVQGMRPIIGFNYGAGEHKRVRKIYEITLIMCAVIMLIGTGICLAIPEQLIGLFSSNPETIRLGGQALTRISVGFLISAVSITSSGALEGLGKGGSSLIISLCRNVIVILPAAYLLSHLGGGVFVWHAFWITEVISAAVSLVVYRRAVRR